MRPRRDEEVYLDARLHGAVLARPLFRSALLVALGIAALIVPFTPAAVVGAVLIAAGAFFTLRAVWQWERTHLVVTTEKVYLLNGTLHRRAKAVHLKKIEAVEIDQSLLGQLLRLRNGARRAAHGPPHRAPRGRLRPRRTARVLS